MKRYVSLGEQIYLGMDVPKFGIQRTGEKGKIKNCCLTTSKVHLSNDRWYMCFSFSSLLVRVQQKHLIRRSGFEPSIGMAGSSNFNGQGHQVLTKSKESNNPCVIIHIEDEFEW